MKKHLLPLMRDINDSWTSLIRKPLRSLLSSLGIGIGVTALIAMLSISEGAQQATLKKIRSLGVDTLRIVKRSQKSSSGKTLSNLSSGLNRSDGLALRLWLGDRGVVGGYRRIDDVSIHHGLQTRTGTILGITPDWLKAEKLTCSQGRLLTALDLYDHGRYCLVGADIASTLQIRLSDYLTYHNQPLTTVGIIATKGRLLTEGTDLASLDFDNAIYLPLTGLSQEFGTSDNQPLDGIIISVNNEKANTLDIAKQVSRLLQTRHKGVEDFEVVIPLSLLKEARASQRTFSLIMGTIAGLSLIVGGIGVLNVMLANIAEQTRDIGLRMAVGATRARIVRLYLCHSTLLTLSGSVWGIVAGVIAALIIQESAGWEVAFSGMSLILAPLSALLTGILFGLHPAVRAASLNPAQALRDT